MKRRRIPLIIIGLLALLGTTACYDEPEQSAYVTPVPDVVFSVNGTAGSIFPIGMQSNGSYAVPELDQTTGAIVFISLEHSEIHKGNKFTVMEVTDLANGEVRDILIVAPDTKRWAHLVWELEHELEMQILFYRGTTYSDNGTAIIAFNRNGNSSTNSTTLTYHTPTITDVGTLIGTIQQGSGKKAGGGDREAEETVLKQNTAYLMRITNMTANDNLMTMKLNWYELINN